MSVDLGITTWIGISLLGLAAVIWLYPVIRNWNTPLSCNESPAGLPEYIQMVREVAHSASSESRENYYAQGLSRVGIMEAEISRLNETP